VTEQTDTQDAINAGIALADPAKLDDAGRFYAIPVPAGGKVEIIDLEDHLEDHRERPRRKTGIVTVHDATSFIAYHAKHALSETEIYADVVRAQLVAVVNAHTAAGDEGLAGWGDHRLRLDLRTTPEWQAWTAHDRKLLDQVTFAEHVEDRIPDFVNPTGADMLELAQSFSANRSVRFESSRRIKNGETQLVYKEETEAAAGKRGDMAIPDTFELGLTPFEGSPAYKVTARLRYRIGEGVLRIGYILDRPEEVQRSAFLDIVNQVQEHVDRTVFRGVPS
jgi:uncharacterized protein YfdQ (DUF2303 family)